MSSRKRQNDTEALARRPMTVGHSANEVFFPVEGPGGLAGRREYDRHLFHKQSAPERGDCLRGAREELDKQ